CVSNMKQITAMVLLYAGDNGGWLPYGTDGTTSWDTVMKKGYGLQNRMLLCPDHQHGTRHYWANANVPNSTITCDSQQSGVMGCRFTVNLGNLKMPSSTFAFVETRDDPGADGNSVPGNPGWGWGFYQQWLDPPLVPFYHLN